MHVGSWECFRLRWGFGILFGSGRSAVTKRPVRIVNPSFFHQRFGLGDQVAYPDTFVDGMGILYKKVIERGGKVIGAVSRAGYTNTASTAIVGDTFVGLPLDSDNQPELTDHRITSWVESLKQNL